MKKKLLKKISLFVALIGLSSVQLTAQTTIINTDFTEAAYDSATQTDLNTVTGTNLWVAGHNTSTAVWQVDGANNQIWTGANFTWSVLKNAPITATVGDKLSITTNFVFSGSTFNPTTIKNLALVGLINTNVLADIKANNGSKRDGTMVVSNPVAGSVAENISITGIGGTLDINPSISQATKAGPYEVIIEYIIGSDAASTVKKVRIKNLASSEVSTVGSVTGIQTDIYTALTGTGAYFMCWAQAFYEATAINKININNLKIVKNGTLVLGVKNFNTSSITSFVSPNPVSSVLTISQNVVTKRYKVVNLIGATVIETEATGSIDVSNLTNGVYLLITDSGVAKFIKK